MNQLNTINDNTMFDLSKNLCEKIESAKLAQYGKERVYVAIGDYQGGRLILQIAVYLSEIPTLIPATGRPTNVSHVKEIKKYILHRASNGLAWILGSLTVNVNPDDIQWQSIGANMYVVTIPNGTPMQISDGQHRIKAITELMASNEHRNLIAAEQAALILVLESDPTQSNVDFGDMAKTMVLSSALLVAYGNVGRDAIAQQVAQRVRLFHNKTQWSQASPGTGTRYIYSLNYVAHMVGCAIAGEPDAQLDKEYDTVTSIELISTELSELLNEFFSCCFATTKLVEIEDLCPSRVAQFKSDSILGLSVGLEVLGHIIYWYRSFGSGAIAINQIATSIDWSRNSDWWSDIIFPQNDAGDLKLRSVSGHSSDLSTSVAHRTIRRLEALLQIC